MNRVGSGRVRGTRLGGVEKQAISVELVECLIAEQFPQWSHLVVRRVDHDGWDNTSFRLGDDLVARLPSADGYIPQVHKEQRWLPMLYESRGVVGIA